MLQPSLEETATRRGTHHKVVVLGGFGHELWSAFAHADLHTSCKLAPLSFAHLTDNPVRHMSYLTYIHSQPNGNHIFIVDVLNQSIENTFNRSYYRYNLDNNDDDNIRLTCQV